MRTQSNQIGCSGQLGLPGSTLEHSLLDFPEYRCRSFDPSCTYDLFSYWRANLRNFRCSLSHNCLPDNGSNMQKRAQSTRGLLLTRVYIPHKNLRQPSESPYLLLQSAVLLFACLVILSHRHASPQRSNSHVVSQSSS